jgi:hypothetical protein
VCHLLERMESGGRNISFSINLKCEFIHKFKYGDFKILMMYI